MSNYGDMNALAGATFTWQNFNLTPGALPGAPSEGMIRSDSGDGNKIKGYYGGAWVTLSGGASGLTSIRYDLVFNSPASFNIGSAVPAGSRIHKVIVSVIPAFDGSSESTLTIGDAGNASRHAAVTDLNLASINEYVIDTYHHYAALTQITGTYVQDGATVGAAYIEIVYSTI